MYVVHDILNNTFILCLLSAASSTHISLFICSSFFFSLLFLAIPHWLLVPQPGIECGTLAVKVWSPNQWTTRGVPICSFLHECIHSVNIH